MLSRDLSLLEVELDSGKEELKQLDREIKLATQPLRAIMRSKTLVMMIPDDVGVELERFAEVYI